MTDVRRRFEQFAARFAERVRPRPQGGARARRSPASSDGYWQNVQDLEQFLDLVKGKRLPWLRIEKPEALIAVHANRPLEVAVETATFHLMDWLITEHGYSPTDAYCLVSTCPDFRINVYQMCRFGKLSFVAGAEIPRRYLGSP